jgi:KaiC/GvpD/RAD55 family RecA-like ATPase
MSDKLKTGIKGLDEILHGGVPEHTVVLVCGTPGTGKSILCSQILYNSALQGKKCLFLNLELGSSKLERQMAQFGWDLRAVENNLKVVSLNTLDPNLLSYLLSEIKATQYDLIVLDSLDSIYSIPAEVENFGKKVSKKPAGSGFAATLDNSTLGRIKLKKIFEALASSKATTFLTSEKVENAPGLTRDTISEFLCDAIILLTFCGLATGANRALEIRKNRLSNFNESINPMEITEKGIVIKPLKD